MKDQNRESSPPSAAEPGGVRKTLATAAIALAVAASAAAPLGAVSPPAAPKSVAESFGFVDHSVTANGARLHYVTTGQGDPVLLIPGWPQSWYAWRYVMKAMAAGGREVYALDPRGFGDSDKTATGYDLATAAEDVHAFIQAVGLARPDGIDVVSHDVGSWIAFAHASAHPEDVRRLVLSEAAIPGTVGPAPTPSDAQNVKTWHFAFNRLNDLPEILVQGHERAYLTWLFANKATKGWMIDPASLDEYVRAFSSPGAARAGFEYYRQAFSDSGLKQMKAWTAHKLAMPVFTLGGEGSLGRNMLTNIEPYAQNARGVVLMGCGHFLPDEAPEDYAKAVFEFWQQVPPAAAAR
jgi:pimeloyl-ACP methyl ester carboxylesterase